MFDPKKIKKDFPILQREAHQGKPLVYLDSAATAQKPQQVIDAISNYYQTSNANIHRGVHILSDESTQVWEASKKIIANFLGAETEELIITCNATEATNGVAYGWGDHNLNKGDIVITTLMEHHANSVVWQELCKRTGAELKTVGLENNSTLDLKHLEKILTTNKQKVKLVNFVHVSNTLGTVNPVEEIVTLVKKHSPNAKILIDAAQSVPHMPVDFHKLKIDFLVFSGHKMLAPMGVGGLLVRKDLLKTNDMNPWLFGGGMIAEVSESSAVYADDLNDRFIAGTPDVASLVGLAEACKYLTSLGMKNVMDHDFGLVKYAYKKLSKISGLKIIGPAPALNKNNQSNRLGSVTFIHDKVHAHDFAQILDSEGVAVRSGHHCTMPLHKACGWQATTRASFNVYSTKDDIDSLVNAFEKVIKIFGLEK